MNRIAIVPKCSHFEQAANTDEVWCERCGVTLDPEDTTKVLAERLAGLGVGHIWTNGLCPAYTSLRASDCTCNDTSKEI